MRNYITEEFTRSLENKDYAKLESLLKFIPYESSWSVKEIGNYDYSVDIPRQHWADYDDYETYKRTLKVYRNWTPLAEVAMFLDTKSIQLVLNNWPNESMDLIQKTYYALNEAYEYLVELDTSEEKTVARNLNLSTIIQAKVIIRHQITKINPSLNFYYSKKDDDAYFNFLSGLIDELDSVDGLINIYNNHISKVSFSYRILNYFFSEPLMYSAYKVQLITLLHEKALQLVGAENFPNLQDSCDQLINSDLFSIKHYRYGVTTRSIQTVLIKNSSHKLDDSIQGFEAKNDNFKKDELHTFKDTIKNLLQEMQAAVWLFMEFIHSIVKKIAGYWDTSQNQRQTSNMRID
jgi:hypothetical protein